MKTVVICPGHYSSYKGVFKNNFHEYDIALFIVNKIVELIDSSEYDVKVVEGSLIDKVNQINEIDPELAIEIHLGNTNLTKTCGSKSYYMMKSDHSKLLAETLLANCVGTLKTKSQGSWIGWYKKITPAMVTEGKAPKDWKAKIDLFLSKVNCPSAIIEPFHISSIQDCSKYANDEKYEIIAKSIIKSIDDFYVQTSTNKAA